MAFALKSPAFSHGAEMPTRYTSEGENVSPPLEWTGAPQKTRSFALIMMDSDAQPRILYHWGIYNIAAGRRFLPEGIGRGVKTEPLGHCLNDFGHEHYDGPALPTADDAHRYRFRLVALDVERLNIAKEAVEGLWTLLRPRVIAEAELIGSCTGRRAA